MNVLFFWTCFSSSVLVSTFLCDYFLFFSQSNSSWWSLAALFQCFLCIRVVCCAFDTLLSVIFSLLCSHFLLNFFQKIYPPIHPLSQLKSAFGSPFAFCHSMLALASLILLFCDQFYMYTFHLCFNQEVLTDKLNNKQNSLSSLISSTVWSHKWLFLIPFRNVLGSLSPVWLFSRTTWVSVERWWVRRKGCPKSPDYRAVIFSLEEYDMSGQTRDRTLD